MPRIQPPPVLAADAPAREGLEFLPPKRRRSGVARVLLLALGVVLVVGIGLGIVYALQLAGVNVLPTSPPASTPVPSGMASLTDHLPAALEGCQVSVGEQPVLALANGCHSSDGSVEGAYTLYEDQASMVAAYDAKVSDHAVTPSQGNCAIVDAWPAEGTYLPATGEERGRLMCVVDASEPIIIWTDDQLLIMGELRQPGGDAQALWQFWATQGRPE